MRVHQFVHNPVPGFLLRLGIGGWEKMALRTASFSCRRCGSRRVPGRTRRRVRAVPWRRRPLRTAWNLNGLAGQFLGAIIFRVGDLEILLVAGCETAQVLGEGGERFLGADFQHHLRRFLRGRLSRLPGFPARRRRNRRRLPDADRILMYWAFCSRISSMRLRCPLR